MAASARTARPMIADLAGHTVDDAVDAAHVLWTEGELFPGDATELLTMTGRIRDWAHEHHISDLDQLTGNIAGNLLKDLTGVTDLTDVSKPKRLEKLHKTRNTLAALRGTVLVARTEHTTTRGQRPGGDSLAAGLPTIAPRTQLSGPRPLRDDEILLTRLLFEIDLMENAPFVPMLAYLLGESGVAAMESTKFERAHLDDPLAPRRLTAAGLWKSGPREIKLDSYVRNALARILPALRGDNQPLSYSGQNTGKSASASTNPVVRRYLARAGVTGTDITAKSLNLWRPDHILRTEGNLQKAVRIHGMRSTNLLQALHCTTDETPLYKNKVAILDHNNKVIAKVPSWHVRAA